MVRKGVKTHFDVCLFMFFSISPRLITLVGSFLSVNKFNRENDILILISEIYVT